MGQGRAVATKEPPTQCLLIKFSLMQSGLLHQDPSLPPPVVATCSSQPRPPHTPYLVPEFGSGMLACQGQPWLSVVTVPLHLNVAFPIVLSSHCAASQPPVAGWMCGLLIWGLLEPSQLGTCGWLIRPPVNDFHLVSFFTKICLIFIPLPCGWIDFKDVLSYVILFCNLDLDLIISKYWRLHRRSCSGKRICRPIMRRVFHAWQIGCRQHYLKLAETPTNKTLFNLQYLRAFSLTSMAVVHVLAFSA